RTVFLIVVVTAWGTSQTSTTFPPSILVQGPESQPTPQPPIAIGQTPLQQLQSQQQVLQPQGRYDNTITNVYPGQEQADYQRDLQQQRQLMFRPTATPTPEPDIEFQEFVGSAVGSRLGIFGQNLFENVPSTFAPLDPVQVTPDYIVGPGDELMIRAWGQISVDYRYVVDRAGGVYIPKVGVVTVAGVKFGDLNNYLTAEVGKVFKN